MTPGGHARAWWRTGWTNATPYHDRFQENRARVEAALASVASPTALDKEFRAEGTSLRCVAREIPPVLGVSSDARGNVPQLGTG